MMADENSKDFKLELVQVLFRHGDRTPSQNEVYPNDPDKSFDYQPYGYGQLTNDGKKRAFKLGKLLRKRYGNFLDQHDLEDFFAYSTISERCQESLKFVLAGLYPANSDQTWNENLNDSTIPFECNPPEKEMFYTAIRHPSFSEWLNQAYEDPKILEKTEKYDEILDSLSEKSGLPRKFETLSTLFRIFHSKKALGLPTPDWCDEELLEKLKRAHEIFFSTFWHNDELKLLLIEEFLGKVMENIQNSINGKNNKKMYLYSAHDVSVYSFLRAHGINYINYINYSATVALEILRGEDDKHYVRIVYWPGEGDQFETLKLKDFDEMCSIEKYLDVIKPFLPKKANVGVAV